MVTNDDVLRRIEVRFRTTCGLTIQLDGGLEAWRLEIWISESRVVSAP